jgi:hypothetical protein
MLPCASRMTHRQNDQVMTLTERPTVTKFCDQGALSSPRRARDRKLINGDYQRQPSPIEAVSGPFLTVAAGFFLDLGSRLGY